MSERNSGNADKTNSYDLNEVARFFRRIAIAEVVAESTLLRHEGVLGGGIHIETIRDRFVLDARAHTRAEILMRRFSVLCLSGGPAQAQAFLELQRLSHFRACDQISRIVAESEALNSEILRAMSTAHNASLITHGATTILSAMMSFVPGAGNAVTRGAALLEALIEFGPKSVTLVALDETADGVGRSYWSKATRTLSNIVDREWRYSAALTNAQVRLQTQLGVVAGTAAIRVAVAGVSLYDGAGEIKRGVAGLARPPQSVSLRVLSTPSLSAPVSTRRPTTHSATRPSSSPTQVASSPSVAVAASKEVAAPSYTSGNGPGRAVPSATATGSSEAVVSSYTARTDWSALDEAIISSHGLW